MKTQKKTITILAFVFFSTIGFGALKPAPKVVAGDEVIKWHTFTEAVELSKKNPKKMFIDVFTEWCGWCKKMDASTFKDPKITKLMNKYFYAVKLDAEMKDSVKFQDHVFKNPDPNGRRSTHELAMSLLNGQMSYPTAVFMDEKFGIITPLPGYQTAEGLEPILVFIGENKYVDTKWEDFIKTYKPTGN